MESLKLTQLATSELKIESVTEFCLHSYDNNIVLWGHGTEFYILEMLYSVDFLIPLPFRVRNVQVTQSKPLTNLIKPIDLVKIYAKSNALESQELSMEPLYVHECSVEPVKARILHAELVDNNCQLCCMLTTYGACEMATQNDILTYEWKPMKTNLSKMLITEVFPIKKSPSDIKTFKQFKDFIDHYTITYFTWSKSQEMDSLVVYLGTANGFIVVLKYLPHLEEYKELFRYKTPFTRIVYITVKDNLLLVGSGMGELILLNIGKTSLTNLNYLWSKKDRMNCRNALITCCAKWKSYFVVFCKGSHILCYRVSPDGQVLANSTLYLKGIKITGLASISFDEFATTSITSTITYVQISCPSAEEILLEPQQIDHNMDTTNLQILGISVSKSRNLWTFLLSRNKDYTHQSKIPQNATFLTVCKINKLDSLTKLININLTTMDVAQDLVIAINLDIINNQSLDKYVEYLNLEHLTCPRVFNDAFLQKLQIKLLIVRFIAKYQKMKYKSYKRYTEQEFFFIETIVQLVYIMLRIQFLQTIRTPDVKLSEFQELSLVCMQTKFFRLLNALPSHTDSNDNHLRNVIEHFVLVLGEEFDKCKFETDKFKYQPEKCGICDGHISLTSFDKCPEGHEIKRCTVSYIQLPMFQTKYCPNCFALANDDTVDLHELFPPNEVIKCTFCRFLLKADIV
ncbi:uncharacterized protein LOC142234877 [Haematobia irritans]|uniref:uncharacterized protein LOC142234877 n=1 Tax=Haematobia irritans TaxID=7368 RepID=UPI003F502DFF